MKKIIIDIGIALITGVISGVLVDVFARKRERMRTTYQFWFNYLFATMKELDMYIDANAISNMPKFKNGDTHFRDTIYEIMDYQHPETSDDREYNDDETQFFQKVLAALEDLGKWKKENKFWF